MNNGFSLIKIISGLSKTLNVANQLIPLYNQVKPILTNGSKILSNLQNKVTTPIQQSNTQKSITTTNNMPTFFQ